MKTTIQSVAFCVLLLCVDVFCVCAKNTVRESDYIYMGMSGGYSVLAGHESPMTLIGDGCVGGHIGIEYRKGIFLFRASGNVQCFKSSCSTPISVPDIYFDDTKGTTSVMHYDMLSPLKETQKILFGGISFMAGYSANSNVTNTLSKYGGFYALGGFGIAYRCMFNGSVALDYATSATYSEYIDDYKDMPNHYYSEYSVERDVNFKQSEFLKNISVMLLLEAGWEWNIKCNKIKLGVFFDWGMNNVMNNEGTFNCTPNMDNVSELIVDSYYNSQEMKNKNVFPIMVGAKIGFSWRTRQTLWTDPLENPIQKPSPTGT